MAAHDVSPLLLDMSSVNPSYARSFSHVWIPATHVLATLGEALDSHSSGRGEGKPSARVPVNIR